MSTLFNITCGAHVFVFYICTLFHITCGAHVFVFCERIRTNPYQLRLSEVCHELNIMFSITIGVGWLRLNDRSRRLRTIRKSCTFARDATRSTDASDLGCCDVASEDVLLLGVCVTFGCRSRLLLAREGAEYRVLLIFCCLHLFSKFFVKDIVLRPMRRADAIDHLASRLVERVSAKTLARHASAQSTQKAGDSPTTVASWSDEEQKTQHKC